MKTLLLAFSLVLSMLDWSGCASTTESGSVGAGRKQFLLLSSQEVETMANQDFAKLKAEARAKGALDRNPQQLARLQSIANRLIPHTGVFRADAVKWNWEVHVISSKEINAFCMPGGKIAFYSGIIEQLQLTDGEIAAIMGHEIAHALREHGRERLSEQVAMQFGIQALVEIIGVDQRYGQLAGMASQVFIGLPKSRGQETEADQVGLELMARGGFAPTEAINLWKKMGASGGGKPPEFLSTHPSDTTRIKQIESILPKVMPLYQQSRI